MNNNFSDLTTRGIEFYERNLKAVLEPDHNGKFVAIEPDSERYFVNEDKLQAILQARAALPDKLFFTAKIGTIYTATLSHYVPKNR